MSEMKETLIPQVVTVTDIRVETPDIKTFRVVTPDGKKPFEHLSLIHIFKQYRIFINMYAPPLPQKLSLIDTAKPCAILRRIGGVGQYGFFPAAEIAPNNAGTAIFGFSAIVQMISQKNRYDLSLAH